MAYAALLEQEATFDVARGEGGSCTESSFQSSRPSTAGPLDSAHRPRVVMPPLPQLIRSPVAAQEAVLPLSEGEECNCCAPLEFALTYKQKSDPERLIEALEQALAIFPPCAGRFAQRAVTGVTGGAGTVRCMCILCNNAGATLTILPADGPLPATSGPLANSFFDRALDAEPGPGGGCGGPLLRMKLTEFQDGQVLAVSFAQGLTDMKGFGHFMRTWASIYRSADPGPPPSFDRIGLDETIRKVVPRVRPEFMLLKRCRKALPRYPTAELALVSFKLSAEEVESMRTALFEERKSRLRTLSRGEKNLTRFDLACAAALASIQADVPVSVAADYRADFGMPLYFGGARGDIFFDVPPVFEDAAGMLRQRILCAQNRDFWAWTRGQITSSTGKPGASSPEGILLCPWTEDLEVADFVFEQAGGGDVAGGCDDAVPYMTLGLAFWQELMDDGWPGCVAVVPHPLGVQVEALLPREAATRLASSQSCKPRVMR